MDELTITCTVPAADVKRKVCTAARALAGQLMGIVAYALAEPQALQLLTELEAAAVAADGKAQNQKFEQQQGNLRALGYVLAQSCTGASSLLPSLALFI